MGNIIGTISWTPTENDHFIITQLRKLSIDCGLSPDTDPNYVPYKLKELSLYSADISGIYLILGKELQANKVRNFCVKSIELLKFLHVSNYNSHIENLAM